MIAKKFTKAFFMMLCCAFCIAAHAQQPVTVTAKTNEHIFHSAELEYIEDAGGKLNIQQASSAAFSSKYIVPHNYYGVNYNRSSVYWFRIKLDVQNPENGMFEFFDQTTDDITAYVPNGNGGFTAIVTGAKYGFDKRPYQHKNFEIPVKTKLTGQQIYYFRIKSDQKVNVIIVYRTIERFVQYALTEYLTFGLFYGMIIIFSFHNLLMFIAVRRKQYLFYVLYILSVGLYEMSVDGIAFQYIWPNYPAYNDYAFGLPLYAISVFALIFTRELLHVKAKAPKLDALIKGVLVLRTLFFMVCQFYDHTLFNYKVLEIIPLSVAFATGIYILKNGFRPARFFVLGYSFLFIGFIVKILCVSGYTRLVPGALAHYSLGFSFILEMVFLSFAIGDQVRILKKKKEKAQQKIMEQMEVNVRLKDSINKELEVQVARRTKEVVQKSNEIFEKSSIIEVQNQELQHKNRLLEKQAEEISRMNVLLEKDNISLKSNIESVNTARVMLTELSFEEFSAKYPDQESCYRYLADLKWKNGYHCIKCNNDNYAADEVKHSRRCTKCRYEESALHNTIFENNKIPLNKAFYLVYLMYFTKGAISSHKLSEKLDIRQSTCWAYANRIKKVMDERKKGLKLAGKAGWSSLIIEPGDVNKAV